MHHIRRVILFIGLILITAALGIILKQTLNKEQVAETPSLKPKALSLSSSALQHNGPIASMYTCKGQGSLPPLQMESRVQNAESYALILHDTQAPKGDAVHWLVWNIPIATTALDSSKLPEGSVQGVSSFGTTTYTAPCPMVGSGEHNYVFELYALGKYLDLPPGSNRDALMVVMNGNLLDQTTLVGKFETK